MLANDDLGVNAEIAGTAQDFNDTAGRSSSPARVANELDVNDSSIKLGVVGKASAASCGNV